MTSIMFILLIFQPLLQIKHYQLRLLLQLIFFVHQVFQIVVYSKYLLFLTYLAKSEQIFLIYLQFRLEIFQLLREIVLQAVYFNGIFQNQLIVFENLFRILILLQLLQNYANFLKFLLNKVDIRLNEAFDLLEIVAINQELDVLLYLVLHLSQGVQIFNSRRFGVDLNIFHYFVVVYVPFKHVFYVHRVIMVLFMVDTITRVQFEFNVVQMRVVVHFSFQLVDDFLILLMDLLKLIDLFVQVLCALIFLNFKKQFVLDFLQLFLLLQIVIKLRFFFFQVLTQFIYQLILLLYYLTILLKQYVYVVQLLLQGHNLLVLFYVQLLVSFLLRYNSITQATRLVLSHLLLQFCNYLILLFYDALQLVQLLLNDFLKHVFFRELI